MTRQLFRCKWFTLEYKREDQWVGHFYRDFGEPTLGRKHWVCLIPCFPISWVRWRKDVVIAFDE